MQATRIRDTGITLFLEFAIEARNIIINTIPDAPRSIVPGKKTKWTRPETNAVIRILIRSLRLPYLFSTIADSTRKRDILPKK